MGRPIKYEVGSTIGNANTRYRVAARCPGYPRELYVFCTHEGCQEVNRVHVSNCLSGSAMKWCDKHREQRATERTIRNRLRKQAERENAVQHLMPTTASDFAEQSATTTGKRIADFYAPLERHAFRAACAKLGKRWPSFKHEGTVKGWMLIGERCTSDAGSHSYMCVCGLCGGVRRIGLQQLLERNPIPRCTFCTNGIWYKRASDLWTRVADVCEKNGFDVTDPLVMLSFASKFGDKYADEVPERVGVSANLKVTLEYMAAEEVARLAQDTATEAMPEIVAEVIDDDSPLHLWPDDRFDELNTSDARLFEWLQADNCKKYNERLNAYTAENARRKALQESNDQA